MTAPVLAEALGPRARRRVAVVSMAAAAFLAGSVVVAVLRLADKGQFDADRWRPFTRWPVWRFLLEGLANTLRAALVAMVLAIVVGAVMALARLARNAALRGLAGLYVQFFRAMPLLLLIYFAGLGLPKYGVKVEPFWFLVLALTIYNGAILGEIFRAGILSLDRGQSEAAYAIGLGYWQAMLSVVVPQAARRMLPAIVSQLVTLLKDTSLGYVIVFPELLRLGRRTGSAYGNTLQAYVVVALIYFTVNFCLSRLAIHLEVRQRRRYGAGAIAVTGVEDLAVLSAQGEARR
ncbi:MAG: amino acid ABC transporter permease [Actinomycetota bacterium]|nr:amino acid ABC transporter permease [Actinomycetota bacterium]